MSGTVRCPHCGHVLFAIELPIASTAQSRDVSPPDAPLLLRVAEAARLLGYRGRRRISLAATPVGFLDSLGLSVAVSQCPSDRHSLVPGHLLALPPFLVRSLAADGAARQLKRVLGLEWGVEAHAASIRNQPSCEAMDLCSTLRLARPTGNEGQGA